MGCVQSCRLSAEERAATTRSREIDRSLKQERQKLYRSRKILLLGSSDSAKRKLLENMNNVMHTEGITKEEAEMYKGVICQNIVDGMVTITCSMQEAGIDFEFPERADDAQSLLELSKQPKLSFSSELVEVLRRLWSDSGVQSGVASSKITSDVKSFLNSGKLDFIGQSDYCLSDSDILWAKETISSNGVWETSFSFGGRDWIIVQLGRSLSRKRYYHCFSDVQAIIFSVDLANSLMVEREEMRMSGVGSMSMAESISMVGSLSQRLRKPVIVLLNKTDFEEKLQIVPLTEAIPEYSGPPGESDAALKYISEQFHKATNTAVFVYQEEIPFEFDLINRTIVRHRLDDLLNSNENELSSAADYCIVCCGCICLVCLLPCWLPCACLYLCFGDKEELEV